MTTVPGAVSLFLNLIDAKLRAIDEVNPDLLGSRRLDGVVVLVGVVTVFAVSAASGFGCS